MILDFDYAILLKPDPADGKDRTVSQSQTCRAVSETCVTGYNPIHVDWALGSSLPLTQLESPTQRNWHDLKSLFLCLHVHCSLYAAPGIIRDLNQDSTNSIIILKRNETKISKEVGKLKGSHLTYEWRKFAACFTPYLPLTECCIQST